MFGKRRTRLNVKPPNLARVWKVIGSEWKLKVEKNPPFVKEFLEDTSKWIGTMNPTLWSSWKNVLVGLGFGVGLAKMIWNNPEMRSNVLRSAQQTQGLGKDVTQILDEQDGDIPGSTTTSAIQSEIKKLQGNPDCSEEIKERTGKLTQELDRLKDIKIPDMEQTLQNLQEANRLLEEKNHQMISRKDCEQRVRESVQKATQILQSRSRLTTVDITDDDNKRTTPNLQSRSRATTTVDESRTPFNLPTGQVDLQYELLKDKIKQLEELLAINVSECDKDIEDAENQVRSEYEEKIQTLKEDVKRECDAFIQTKETSVRNEYRGWINPDTLQQKYNEFIEEEVEQNKLYYPSYVQEQEENLKTVTKTLEKYKTKLKESKTKLEECGQELEDSKALELSEDQVAIDRNILQNLIDENKNLEKKLEDQNELSARNVKLSKDLQDRKLKLQQHQQQLTVANAKLEFKERKIQTMDQELKQQKLENVENVRMMLEALQNVILYINDLTSEAKRNIRVDIDSKLSNFIGEPMDLAKKLKLLNWSQSIGGGVTDSLAYILRRKNIPKVIRAPTYQSTPSRPPDDVIIEVDNDDDFFGNFLNKH